MKGVVLGNGTEGHEQRIQTLEEKTEPKNCIGKQALEEHLAEIKEEKSKKRSFRASEIANWIQLLVVLLMAYQIFWG